MRQHLSQTASTELIRLSWERTADGCSSTFKRSEISVCLTGLVQSSHSWPASQTQGAHTISRGNQRRLRVQGWARPVIIWAWGRFWWRGSCWWRWRRPGWASATAASWRTSWCVAPSAPTPSSTSQSSGRLDAWTDSASGEQRRVWRQHPDKCSGMDNRWCTPCFIQSQLID